jgi:hypothetical protein
MTAPLDKILTVTALAAGASVTLPHGLTGKPTSITPDRATPIGVTTVTDSSVTFTNLGSGTESSFFWAKRDHSIQQDGSVELYWQGSAGFASFQLTNPQWNDLMIPDTALRNGASAPTLTTFSGGIRLNAYAAGNEAYMGVQIPHSWVEGGIIEPHVHCSFPNANAGNFVWGLEYTFATPGILPGSAGGLFAGTTVESAVTAAPAAALRHHIVELPTIDLAGMKVSTMLLARIFRKAGVAAAYASDIFLCELDFHILQNTLGSRTEYDK